MDKKVLGAVKAVSVLSVLFVVFLAGCKPTQEEADLRPSASAPGQPAPPSETACPVPGTARSGASPAQAQEEYNQHYAQGLVLLADKKYEDALAEFQKAQSISNTVEVAAQIEKIKQTLGADREAAQLVTEVEALHKAGRLEDASRKAADGVEKYWNTPSGPRLVELKKAVDAEVAGRAADKQALADKEYQKAQDYYKQGDLRNAYLTLGETTKYSQDPRISAMYEDAKSRMTLYDESLHAADAYMKNPDTYEDAIVSLEAAQKVWDTTEVRNRLESAQKALKSRRARVAVVDFETKGDFEVPNAGGAVAELLLPRFQSRFDLIERAQLAKLLQEQNLQMTDLVEASAAEKLAKIKRVQYLVMGSLMRFGGIHVTARMVQVDSGLIQNTGKISPPGFQEIDPYLKDLAAQLTMSEEDYRAYQARQPDAARERARALGSRAPVEPARVIFEGVTERDFRLADEGAFLPEEPPTSWREEQFKRELYDNLMGMGQEFMSRRQYYEAARQFEMALLVYPGDARAMSLLSEASRLMTWMPPPAQPRDRVAVFDFIPLGGAPPFAGAEAAALLGSYLSRDFEVVDRDQLYWYMHRMRVTMRQLLHSRQRLMWFGRIFRIRYFIMGYLLPSRSFDVAARVVDAADGLVKSEVRMHVFNADDLRFRMPEFSRALFLGYDERRAWMEQCNRRFELYRSGQTCMRENKFGEAMRFFAELMGMLQPDRDRTYYVESRRSYEEAQSRQRLVAPPKTVLVVPVNLEAAQRERREAERRAAEMRRQLDMNYRAALDEGRLAMAAGDYAAAMRAFAAAMNLKKTDEAEDAYRSAKKKLDAQKAQWEANEKAERRYASCMESGRKMLLLGRFADAVKSYQDALEVRRTEEAQTALADAQRRYEEQKRQSAEEDKAKRDADRIERSYKTYMSAAREDAQKHRYADAVTNYTRALALKKTPEAEAGLLDAQRLLADKQEKDRLLAEQKALAPGAVAPGAPRPARQPEADRKKKDEKREQPEAPSREELAYNKHMTEGRALMEKQDFERAARSFAQAYGLKKSDEARVAYDEAVKKTEESKAAQKAEKDKALEEARKKKEEDQKAREAAEEQGRLQAAEKTYADAVASGKRFLEGKQYEAAINQFSRALRIKQTAEAQALLDQAKQSSAQLEEAEKAEKERARKEKEDKLEADRKAREERKKKEDEAERVADEKAKAEALDRAYARYMEAGQLNVRRKRFDAAMKNFADALNAKKTDEAQAALDQARAALDAEKAEADRQRLDDQQKAKEAADRKAAEDKAKEEAKQRGLEERRKKAAEEKAAEEQQRQERERKAAEEKAAAENAREAAYKQRFEAAMQFEQQGNFAEAMNAYSDAFKVKKTEEARDGFQRARAKLQAQQPAPEQPKEEPRRRKRSAEPQPDEQEGKKQEDDRAQREAQARAAKLEETYQKYMSAGAQAANQQQYDRAVKYFEAAYKTKPTDEAKAAYQDAQQKLQSQQQQGQGQPGGGEEEKSRKKKRR